MRSLLLSRAAVAAAMFAAASAHAQTAQARRVFGPLWRTQTVESGPCFLSAFLPASDSEHCTSWTRRETSGVAFHVATGILVVGGSDKRLKGLRGTDGTVAWDVATPGAVMAKPTLDADAVFIGTDDGHVLRADVTSGRQRWDVTVDAEVTEPIVVDGELALVVTGADTVYALDRATGEPRWVHKHPLPRAITIRGQARPVVATVQTAEGPRRRVFVGHASGRLSVLDRQNGTVIAEYNLSDDDVFGDLDADPLMQNGHIVVASQTRGVMALDSLSGAQLWKQPENGIVRLARGGNQIVVAGGAGKILGLDAASGVVRWRFTFDKGAPTRMVVQGGRVHVGSDRGSMYVLDLFSGRPLQYIGEGQGFAADPEVASDMLFAVGTTGDLSAWSSAFAGNVLSSVQGRRSAPGRRPAATVDLALDAPKVKTAPKVDQSPR